MPQSSQEKVRGLVVSSGAVQGLITDFELYHKSVEQKLWSANYCSESLKLAEDNLYPSAIRNDNQTDDTSSTSALQTQPPINLENYCRFGNLYLDGFLMNAMSVLDTLARVICTLYYYGANLGDIYLATINSKLAQSHPNSRLTSQIQSELNQTWLGDFRVYRTCTTHESLINYEIDLQFDYVRNTYRIPKLKLPDDPRAKPVKHKYRREVKSYCQTTNRRVKLLVDRVYKSMLDDISNSGNNLPIP